MPTVFSPPASTKKQQSISNFFGKNASNAIAGDKLPRASRVNTEKDEESLFLDSPENEIENLRPSRAEKRPKEGPNGRNEYGIDLPSQKKLKLSEQQHNGRQDEEVVSSSIEVPLARISANVIKNSVSTERASKYAFSSSPAANKETRKEDDQTQRDKDQLHRRFVDKLGRPDSIAEIKRRNWLITEETQAEENGDDGALENEEEAAPVKKGSKTSAIKKGGGKLTPMEKQYLDIKRKHLDTVLIVEVGYKFKFFGEDARIAARELSIVCIPGKFRYDEHLSEAHYDRFASASVPVHRLHVHVKRLVSAGHKVGVVRQLETAAFKAAGDNRNAPFTRKLTNLYTKGTYIDDVEGLEGPLQAPSGGAPATGYLVCLTESNATGWGTD